jgi:superfamily II DNA or RNA helicase
MNIDFFNNKWLILTQLDHGTKSYLMKTFAGLIDNYPMLPRYSTLGKSACYVKPYFDYGDFVLIPHNLFPEILKSYPKNLVIDMAWSKYMQTRFDQTMTYVLDSLGIDYPKKKHNLQLTIDWYKSKGLKLTKFDPELLASDKITRMLQSQVQSCGKYSDFCNGIYEYDDLADLDHKDFKKILNDNRDKIESCLPGIKLREFQTDAVINFFTYSLERANKTYPWPLGLVKAPARSGKTEVICAISKLLKNQSVLVLTDRKQLIRQIRERMIARKLDDKIGYVDGGKNAVENITVSTIQSIGKNQELRTKPYLVIVDEAHTCSNESFIADYDKMFLNRNREDFQGFLLRTTAPIILGTSATPFGYNEVNNQMIKSGFGDVVYNIRRKQLEELGIVAKSRVIIFKLDHNNCIKDYKAEERTSFELYKENYAFNYSRNELSKFAIKLSSGSENKGRHLILVKNKDHIDKLVSEQFPNAMIVFGNKSETYRCEETKKTKTRTIASMGVKQREKVIKEFLAKDDAILIATSVVFTGIDFPGGMHTVVNLAAGSSFESIIQRICRGLNPNDEDREVKLFDIYDCGYRFAKLAEKSELRKKAYELEEFDVSIKNIPQKFFSLSRN